MHKIITILLIVLLSGCSIIGPIIGPLTGFADGFNVGGNQHPLLAVPTGIAGIVIGPFLNLWNGIQFDIRAISDGLKWQGIHFLGVLKPITYTWLAPTKFAWPI